MRKDDAVLQAAPRRSGGGKAWSGAGWWRLVVGVGLTAAGFTGVLVGLLQRFAAQARLVRFGSVPAGVEALLSSSTVWMLLGLVAVVGGLVMLWWALRSHR